MSFIHKIAPFFALIMLIQARVSFACEFCTIPQMGKHEGVPAENKDENIFVKYIFEVHNFDVMDAQAAHELHHDGHHFHDKVKEYVHHLNIGLTAEENLTFIADIPYVIRKSLEVDSHAILGSKQTSEGLGDVTTAGLYRFWHEGDRSASAIAGVKFPSGETHEKNSIGTRFEAELQPGSGSFDYFWGGIARFEGDRQDVTANLVYILKRQGAQDYTFGDVLSVSGLWEASLLQRESSALKIGVDGNLQYEQRHKDRGKKIADSGGVIFLLGPTLNVALNDATSVFASAHFPAYQNLGGVHQEMDYTWSAGGKITF